MKPIYAFWTPNEIVIVPYYPRGADGNVIEVNGDPAMLKAAILKLSNVDIELADDKLAIAAELCNDERFIGGEFNIRERTLSCRLEDARIERIDVDNAGRFTSGFDLDDKIGAPLCFGHVISKSVVAIKSAENPSGLPAFGGAAFSDSMPRSAFVAAFCEYWKVENGLHEDVARAAAAFSIESILGANHRFSKAIVKMVDRERVDITVYTVVERTIACGGRTQWPLSKDTNVIDVPSKPISSIS